MFVCRVVSTAHFSNGGATLFLLGRAFGIASFCVNNTYTCVHLVDKLDLWFAPKNRCQSGGKMPSCSVSPVRTGTAQSSSKTRRFVDIATSPVWPGSSFNTTATHSNL